MAASGLQSLSYCTQLPRRGQLQPLLLRVLVKRPHASTHTHARLHTNYETKAEHPACSPKNKRCRAGSERRGVGVCCSTCSRVGGAFFDGLEGKWQMFGGRGGGRRHYALPPLQHLSGGLMLLLLPWRAGRKPSPEENPCRLGLARIQSRLLGLWAPSGRRKVHPIAIVCAYVRACCVRENAAMSGC